ncbi:sorbosone dehydrogenase family protein [Arthrobacter sp. B0490]|uniref:PQQ-dependent sugar dehydrogenase n=1 Tax=Arthrobacter sp. B0490 TaxID=2058891 RepID=UPI000CE38150|nr:PQQ-dependent sugar dehydrogenase [Arthrobacter sp. B0490]
MAAARQRPARLLTRILPAAGILLGLAGCSVASPEPDPLYAGASATPPASPGSAAPPAAPAALPGLEYGGDAATGLGLPWSVVVLDGGGLVVSERETGEIKRVSGTATEVIGSIPEAAAASGEGGLLGLAVGAGPEPDALYAYYTSATDNRVVRMPWTDGRLGAPEPILTGIPKADIHNGGRLAVGPDGHLYIGTGDAGTRDDAQDPDGLGGKILRITPDGGIPDDNPTPGSPVYSLGHRNVQGLAWDSAGRLWASEFGPEVDDELNLVTPGGNYGWPEVTGAPGDARYIDAQVVWPSTAASSPSGMAILADVAYIGGLRGQRLWQVPLRDGTAGEPVSHFDGEYGRLRDVTAGTDGSLLVATNESGDARILRIGLDAAR